MNMTNIDQNLLYRYFAKETSHDENAAVGEWLRSDEMHQKEFDKELKMFLYPIMRKTRSAFRSNSHATCFATAAACSTAMRTSRTTPAA